MSSTHQTSLNWERKTNPENFNYDTYVRDHTLTYDGGCVVQASSAAKYGGNAQFVDPEEMFVSALASCQMLTFMALATKKRYVVDSYKDNASCVLEKTPEGGFAVTSATLRPEVKFSSDRQPSREQIEKMLHQAHKNCVIANSVKTRISVEPVF